MDQSKFSLSWEDYKASVCKGLSSLQQNGEFVDMTLAADGHLVKVHQVIIALASPFFKELLASAPCKHPVIFLNSVPHDVLCSLLEYIYTGQVIVRADKLTKFFETAKALHIRGLYDMNINDMNNAPSSMELEIEPLPPVVINDDNTPDAKVLGKYDKNESKNESKTKSKNESMKKKNGRSYRPEWEDEPLLSSWLSRDKDDQNSAFCKVCNCTLITRLSALKEHASAKKHEKNIIRYSGQSSVVRVPKAAKRIKVSVESSTPGKRPYHGEIINDDVDDRNDYDDDNCSNKSMEITESSTAPTNKGTVQYTVSNRGSLQVILNRYIYNLHSTSNRNGNRRWRCVDYRDKKCSALLTTKGNIVYSRANLHNHAYHDKKILQKVEMNAVYSAIQDVQGVKGAAKDNDDENQRDKDNQEEVLDFTIDE